MTLNRKYNYITKRFFKIIRFIFDVTIPVFMLKGDLSTNEHDHTQLIITTFKYSTLVSARIAVFSRKRNLIKSLTPYPVNLNFAPIDLFHQNSKWRLRLNVVDEN